MRTSKVIKRFGQWVVTTYGIECVDGKYAIRKHDLKAGFLEKHICEKNWVVASDFRDALQWARENIL